MQPARALDLIEFAPQPRHAIADQPAVGFALRFAGAAEKAAAAALAFEVGPTPHQPPGLLIEMRQLDLAPPFGGRRGLAADFADPPGSVANLGLEGRSEGAVGGD